MQRLSSSRVAGGALNFVLAVGIILSAFVSAVFLLSYHRLLVLAKSDRTELLERNATSGVSYLLAHRGEYIEEHRVDLFHKGNDSVSLVKQPWGLYDVVASKAFSGTSSRQRIGLVGTHLDSLKGMALYLADEDRPLYLAKNVLIQGRAFLPRAGFRRVQLGQANGETDNGSSLDGQVLKSLTQLPPGRMKVLERVMAMTEQATRKAQAPAFQLMDHLNDRGELAQSFLQETLAYQSRQPIYLNGLSLSGNITVKSDVSITIGRDSRLEDVLLVAPYIQVEEGFAGTVQLFATDSIIVNKNCHLSYPSVLGVFNSGTGGAVRLEEGSSLTGEILVGGEAQQDGFHLVSLRRGVTVNGLVYVDGVVEQMGEINGGLLCRRLMHRTASSVYDNYLMDATISAQALSAFYLASPAWHYTSKREIIKWLE